MPGVPRAGLKSLLRESLRRLLAWAALRLSIAPRFHHPSSCSPLTYSASGVYSIRVMRFVWDPEKDKVNRARHDLSFEESTELFKSGVDYLEIYDEAHSEKEDRFIAVGPIKRGVIVLAYTERDDEVLRLLSARMATKNERRGFEAYEKDRHGRRDS